MLTRRICTPIRSLPRIPLQRTGLRPPRIQRNYTTSKKSSRQSYPDPVPTPANLRRLRSKEHLLRKAIIRGFLAATVAAYYLDGKYNARAIRRTLRTAWVGATLAADYKWNFTFTLPIVCAYNRPEKADSIEELHKRVARRIMELISANGGLYIKLGMHLLYQRLIVGQALAMQAAVLPPAYGEAFSTLFDEAPQMSYEDVVAVFKRDFGKTPEEIFDIFETNARASASIATVFKARLKSGEWVAVKVQKPEIEKQVQVSPIYCSSNISGIYLHTGFFIETTMLIVEY
jgi:aarF domain-containing kinase